MNDPSARLTMTEIRARLEAVKAGAEKADARDVRGSTPRPEDVAAKGAGLVVLVHDGSDRGVLELALTGATEALRNSELALVLETLLREDAATRLSALIERLRPAGLLLLPPLAERDDLAALCEEARVPCARLGYGSGGLACDDRGAMVGVIHWLVEQGHRRIGLVGGPEDSLFARERELGYLDALADHGLDRGASLIVAGDNSFESGLAAGRLLLEVSPRPSAIVACNDEMAAGVLAAATQAGVAVPEALSVVGFDDAPLAVRTVPALTSVHVPWQRMAREAATGIAGAVFRPEDASAYAAALVLRDSAAPAQVRDA